MNGIPAGCICGWDETEDGRLIRIQAPTLCDADHSEPDGNITAFGGITLPPLAELIGMENA